MNTPIETLGVYFPDLSPTNQAIVLEAMGREPNGDDPLDDDLLYIATCGCVHYGHADDVDGLLYLCRLHAATESLLAATKELRKALYSGGFCPWCGQIQTDRHETLCPVTLADAAIAAAEGKRKPS